MSIGTALLLIIVLLLIGALPAWPYSQSWGHGPAGALGFAVMVVIVLIILGVIR